MTVLAHCTYQLLLGAQSTGNRQMQANLYDFEGDCQGIMCSLNQCLLRLAFLRLRFFLINQT